MVEKFVGQVTWNTGSYVGIFDGVGLGAEEMREFKRQINAGLENIFAFLSRCIFHFSCIFVGSVFLITPAHNGREWVSQ